MSREALITRKEAIRAELIRTHRRLEHARVEVEAASGLRRRYLQRRVAQLEGRADALMSEEYRLRQLIDQSR
jgi:hypothetical protein